MPRITVADGPSNAAAQPGEPGYVEPPAQPEAVEEPAPTPALAAPVAEEAPPVAAEPGPVAEVAATETSGTDPAVMPAADVEVPQVQGSSKS
ncbi:MULTISPECIES: hypothetical protein [unclassified Kitasatospora]|uniref:hypothetical protein n=1 Tax=unclassified Kitasatospora TaxID=2633591 RepID=UPI002476261C|nr:hypothetical protein [Kitasatospora sp. GAS204B]